MVITAAQLMVVLDTAIVNVALPHIQHALHLSGTNLEWVVNAYTLAFGGLLLLGGRSGDLLGRRRILMAGIALFALGRVPGGGGDRDPRGDHRAGDDPGQEVGPGRHRPDGGPNGLSRRAGV